jgi:hypothetical protein
MLTHKDLMTIQDKAKDFWLDISEKTTLKDGGRPLTSGECHALATFNAVVQLLNSKGLITNVEACKFHVVNK